MDWEQAWERDKYEVGRQMHLGWKRQKIANGFADHPFAGQALFEDGKRIGTHPAFCATPNCGRLPSEHHDDMIDWDGLPPHQQAINFEGGREGYRMGFEARQRDAARRLGGVAGETFL